MKLALFYFQNGFSKKALKIALDVGKMFRSLFHFSRAYYSFILAFHCTSSNKKKVYILLQLLSLPPFKSNDDEMLFSKHYNVIGHHLLSQKQVNIELNALFPLVENIKIDAKYVFKVSFQPTMLTSCIPLPLQCKINNVETTLLPDQPILLNNFYSNILIHIPKGPILVVPISNTQTIDREWEGVTGVKLTLTKQVQTFHIKGRVFLKDGFAEYLHKTSQQQRSSKVIIKKGNIDLSGFTTPCELALYLPIHGLSEPRKCSCKFTCSGEIDYIYKTSVFVKDPITFPTTVNPIHDNGKWIVSIPITNTVKRTLIINKIFIVVSNDIIASFDEELSLDENETHTIQIEGCENGIGQLSIEFTYNGKVYEYNNTIHFVKIPSLYCVQFSLDKTMIRRGEAISVKLILKSNIDNKHVLIQVESNNTFCVCGFNTRKIQLEVGESLEIDYKFISIHSGYCQLPKFHFIRNDKEVCVEYQNTLQDVIVLQESDWFDVV
ncbi:Trafficking protein particle complex subunit 11 C-terminal domain-containing protein [Entamoeba marina]